MRKDVQLTGCAQIYKSERTGGETESEGKQTTNGEHRLGDRKNPQTSQTRERRCYEASALGARSSCPHFFWRLSGGPKWLALKSARSS